MHFTEKLNNQIADNMKKFSLLKESETTITDHTIVAKQVLYLVMKLSMKVEYNDPYSGKPVSQKLGGCYGYCPVFDNEANAIESAQDGKYQIVAITQQT